MVFPLYDDDPFQRQRPPVVTWLLIAVNVVVFFGELATAGSDLAGPLIDQWALIPAHIVHTPADTTFWRSDVTLVTAMFLHGGWLHIIGNMIYLFVFGDDIEDALGPVRFLCFYLLVGVAANLGYVFLSNDTTTPLLGASGAIAGVLSAYLMLRPCAHVTVFLFGRIARVRAYWVIGFWIVLQLYSFLSNEQDGVAYLAHLGGLVAGAVLLVLMKPAGVHLFECIPQPGEETA
jgi:membrane associated rhomboid family serine protease